MILPDAFHDADEAMARLKELAPDAGSRVEFQYLRNTLFTLTKEVFGDGSGGGSSEPEMLLTTEKPEYSRMFK